MNSVLLKLLPRDSDTFPRTSDLRGIIVKPVAFDFVGLNRVTFIYDNFGYLLAEYFSLIIFDKPEF